MAQLTEIKKVIKNFRANKINYYKYYKYILLNNTQSWHFVNPNECRQSFQTGEHFLKYLILKRLLNKGYKLKPLTDKKMQLIKPM